MKPEYELTSSILELITSISEMIGEINANYLDKQSPTLRKQNKIKTIHSSLQIEGNTLSEAQITALIENKRVIGPQKDILEVLNAIDVYDRLRSYKASSEKAFLNAHKTLMKGLIENPGKYRTTGVGIVKGSKVTHLAPPAQNLTFLMRNLFDYLKSKEIALIKSCVFHYEMEFIHPFLDGNGRMGRLWQTLILMEKYPVFEFLPFETLISRTQNEYYAVLSACDKAGNSTLFIEYLLKIIQQSLNYLLTLNNRIIKHSDRIEYFLQSANGPFSRKDYMTVFKDISTATASRDLKKAVELGYLSKEGSDNKTLYRKT